LCFPNIRKTTFISNHKLPIEHGRWNNIPRENRKCNSCNLEEIGDEFHYILNCPLSNIEIFKSRRDTCIQKDQILLTSWGLWRTIL
jgi:hypothetical protein